MPVCQAKIGSAFEEFVHNVNPAILGSPAQGVSWNVEGQIIYVVEGEC